eukprot:1153750-Pelagomonas_calceolata.AAC.9
MGRCHMERPCDRHLAYAHSKGRPLLNLAYKAAAAASQRPLNPETCTLAHQAAASKRHSSSKARGLCDLAHRAVGFLFLPGDPLSVRYHGAFSLMATRKPELQRVVHLPKEAMERAKAALECAS